MSRPRKSNPLNLEPRMRFKHGAFYYVHRDNRWENLGSDYLKARAKARHYNGTHAAAPGTMAHYFSEWFVWLQSRVATGATAPRTLADYRTDSKPVLAFLGHLAPTDITPPMIQQYLDIGVELNRATRANREKACLSSCLTWIRSRRPEAGLKLNPCHGVFRNPESVRDRYVTDAEYAALKRRATPMLLAHAELIYRTLQRPADVLRWTRANIRTITRPDSTSVRVIETRQNKTGSTLKIEIDHHIAAVIDAIKLDAIGVPLIRGRNNKAASQESFKQSWLRFCKAALATGEIDSTFGVMDLRAKGATDMYVRGVPLEQIQALMGHKSITTTEIYIKHHLHAIVQPNKTAQKGSK